MFGFFGKLFGKCGGGSCDTKSEAKGACSTTSAKAEGEACATDKAEGQACSVDAKGKKGKDAECATNKHADEALDETFPASDATASY